MLVLKNSFRYTGQIQEIDGETIIFLDKYQKTVMIHLESISEIQEK